MCKRNHFEKLPLLLLVENLLKAKVATGRFWRQPGLLQPVHSSQAESPCGGVFCAGVCFVQVCLFSS